MRKETYGYAAVILAAALWGIGGSVAKALFIQSVTPFLLVKLRLTMAFLFMAAGMFLYDRKTLYIRRKDLLYFISLGVCGMAMMQFTYLYTISLTNVATAVFLQYLAPVFMALYAVLWEKIQLGRRRVGAVLLATLGGLLIMLDSGGASGVNIPGMISGLASAAVFAFNSLYIRRAVKEYNPMTATVYSFGFGALFWWFAPPYSLPLNIVTADNWWLYVYLAIFSTVIPYLLYFVGVSLLPATNAGVTACLEPVIAASTAYLALGESMGWLQMAGGGLVILAVIVIQTAKLDDNENKVPVLSEKP